MKELVDFFAQGQPHFVLDLDGTLIPIQENHYVESLPEVVHETLACLKSWPVTILSGRSQEDLSRLFAGLPVSLAPLNGLQETAPELRQRADQLRECLAASLLIDELSPVQVEAKGPLTTLHFRHAPELESLLFQRVQEGLSQLPFKDTWHTYVGKKVLNIEPEGGLKRKFLENYLQTHPAATVLFAGDDANDHDALSLEHPRLWTVWVIDNESPSGVSYGRSQVHSITELHRLLRETAIQSLHRVANL